MRTRSLVSPWALSRRAPLAPYWQVTRRTFQRFSTYRGATFAGLFTNTVFAFLKVFVFLAAYRTHARIGSFDAVDVVTFTFVGEGLAVAVGAFADTGLGNRLRTGDVSTDLYRPLHFGGYWLAEDLGRAGFQLLARGILPVLIAAAFFTLRLPPRAGVWIAFTLSLVLAVLVSFAFRFLVTLSGFWLLDIRGAWQVAVLVSMFFSGLVVPVTFFPAALQHVAGLTPFPSMLQLPVEIFLGKHAGVVASGAVLGRQALWAGALFALGEYVVSRAFRRVVIQGG